MPYELIYRIEGRTVRYPLVKDEVIIGRSSESDLLIEHRSVSRRHARLFRDGTEWKVVDLGSRNGTRINDLGHADKPLRHGDRIHLCEIPLVFVDASVPAPPEALGAAEPPIGPDSLGQTVCRSAVDFAALAVAQSTVEPARGLDPLERLRRLLAIVTQTSEAILASGTVDETFRRILDLVFEHLPVQRGSIMLWDEPRGLLVTRCARDDALPRGAPSEVRVPRTIVDRVLRERVALVTMDAQLDSRFAAGASIIALGTRSAMAAPLWRGKHVEGLIYVDTAREARAFDDFDLDLLSALGNHLAVAIERARLQELALEKERLESELAVAHEIQVGTLPRAMPGIPGYDLAGLCQPAAETGGDTFDLIPLEDGRLLLLVGDATGHGVGPALCATQVRAMLRIASRLGACLDDAFRHINDQLAQDLADNRYVTAFLGLLDGLRHEVQYHSGGQGPIMIYRAETKDFEWRAATTVPLGFFVRAKLDQAETITLGPGDLLGLITDGVFESENPASEMFGIARVEELVRRNHESPMSRLAEALLEETRRFAGGRAQNDDITIVLLRRLPERESQGRPIREVGGQ